MEGSVSYNADQKRGKGQMLFVEWTLLISVFNTETFWAQSLSTTFKTRQ